MVVVEDLDAVRHQFRHCVTQIHFLLVGEDVDIMRYCPDSGRNWTVLLPWRENRVEQDHRNCKQPHGWLG